MKLFKDQPRLTEEHKKRLSPALGGWNKLVSSLSEGEHTEADLKRLLLIELETDNPRKEIVKKLIVALQKSQREGLIERILCLKPDLKGL